MTINTYLHGPHMSDGRKSWEVAYSWELQARPVDPSTIVPAPVSNNNLSILNANHTEATQVNNTLYGLDDWGVILVIADVNMYRYMEEQGWNWEFDRLNSTGTLQTGVTSGALPVSTLWMFEHTHASTPISTTKSMTLTLFLIGTTPSP